MKENNLNFFDINFWVGEHNNLDKFSTKEEDVHSLLNIRSINYDIYSTVISHFLSLFYSPKLGNDSLVPMLNSLKSKKTCKFDAYGAMCLEHELIFLEDTFENFLKKRFNQGFRIIRLFPKSHKYPYEKNLLKRFYQVCHYYHFPIMITLEEIDLTGDKFIDWNELYEVSKSFKNMPIIIDGGNSKALQFSSYFILLFQNSSNIYLTTHNLYAFNQIEDMVSIGSSKRLIFDSYFPFSDTFISTQRIINSGLSYKDKEGIAFNNIDRIIKNIEI